MNTIVKGALLGAAVGGIGAGVRARQSGAPGPDVQASALKGVAARTKAEFGDPWGLVATDLATGRAAGARGRATLRPR